MDIFQIKSKLDLFSIQVPDGEDVEKLRNILKKTLLEEILKVDIEDREFYETCLKETFEQLALVTRPKTGYVCCLVGCKFRGKNHRNYVIHLKRDHPNIRNITCNFEKKCRRSFSGVDTLMIHLKEAHSSHTNKDVVPQSHVAIVEINIPCKCNRISCGGLHYPNIKDLMSHYNTYHGNEERDCIFLDCKTTFHASLSSTARNHFRIKHKHTGKLKLKARHLLIPDVSESSREILPQEADIIEEDRNVNQRTSDGEDYDEDQLNALENLDFIEDSDNDELSEDYYLQYYSDFLNRLGHFKYIPQSTIQEISEEYLLNTKKSLERREKALRKSLNNIKDLSQTDIEKIVTDVIENDAFLNAQQKLNTEYKRSKFIQESRSYVSPKEILLNKAEVQRGEKKDVLHYVPITESFKTLVQDPSFNEMVAMRKADITNEKIRDIKDGSVYKNSEYFNENPEALTAILYSDGVEMKNPLGAARGTYKIVQVFYTLGEIEKSQRSKIDRLQLIMVFREKLLKKYSLKTIYRLFVDDLKRLELGVVVHFPMTRRVKCGILCYSTDNLEASLVGGFSACFSSKDVCRVCHIEHKQLEDQIHDIHGKVYSFWSVEEYDRIIRITREEEMDVNDTLENIEVVPKNLFTEFSPQS